MQRERKARKQDATAQAAAAAAQQQADLMCAAEHEECGAARAASKGEGAGGGICSHKAAVQAVVDQYKQRKGHKKAAPKQPGPGAPSRAIVQEGGGSKRASKKKRKSASKPAPAPVQQAAAASAPQPSSPNIPAAGGKGVKRNGIGGKLLGVSQGRVSKRNRKRAY